MARPNHSAPRLHSRHGHSILPRNKVAPLINPLFTKMLLRRPKIALWERNYADGLNPPVDQSPIPSCSQREEDPEDQSDVDRRKRHYFAVSPRRFCVISFTTFPFKRGLNTLARTCQWWRVWFGFTEEHRPVWRSQHIRGFDVTCHFLFEENWAKTKLTDPGRQKLERQNFCREEIQQKGRFL